MAVSNTDNRVQYSITSTPTTSTEYSYPNRVSAVTDIVVQETTQTPRIPGTITFNQSSDQFALTTHGLVTGNVVQFDGTAITGFTADIDYYVVKIDANNFQLATSVANATASPAVVVTVSGTDNVSVTTLIRAGEQPLTRTLTQGSDYTITPETSGTLITSLVVNPTQAAIDDDKFAVGSTITIYRETNFQQTSNYVPNQIIPADTLEGDLDKLAMMAQQLKDDVGRSVRFAESVTDPANLEIAFDADQRSGKLLSFDADGNFSVSQEIGVWRSAWQSGRAYSARDLVFNDDDTSDDRYSIYFAKTTHTSDSSTAPLEVGANWDKVLDASFFATQVELAQTSGGAANDAADLAQEWASKTDGIVDSTDYSAKAYATGGTGLTTGSAKDWAITAEDTEVTTGLYSSLHWAAKSAASATASASSATTAEGHKDAAAASAAAALVSEGNAATSETAAQTAANTAVSAAIVYAIALG